MFVRVCYLLNIYGSILKIVYGITTFTELKVAVNIFHEKCPRKVLIRPCAWLVGTRVIHSGCDQCVLQPRKPQRSVCASCPGLLLKEV